METVSAYVSKNTNLNNGLPCTIKSYSLSLKTGRFQYIFFPKKSLFIRKLWNSNMLNCLSNNCFREFYAFIKEMYIIWNEDNILISLHIVYFD